MDPSSHFGDIMSFNETNTSIQGEFSPFERICITANGNLQRILSAYFNAKIKVEIIKNIQISASPLTFDRKVELILKERVICTADSIVKVSDPFIIEKIVNDGIGIGQIFRILNILPEFELLAARRIENGFSRKYTLKIKGMECIITESFTNYSFESGENSKLSIAVNNISSYEAPQ